jgi:hypothetical protein
MQTLIRSALLALLAAVPLAAQPASDLLANEGMDLAAPPGWPPFEQIREVDPNPRVRMYRTQRDGRVVLLSVASPLGDADRDLAGRSALLELFSEGPGSGTTERVRTWEDSTHLVSDARVTLQDGRRGVMRNYVPRFGTLWSLRILVTDEPGTPDPAEDPEVRSWLGQIRPRADEPRPPAPLTFDEAGVQVTLPPGIPLPAQFFENAANGVRIFRSQAGSRGVRVFVAQNQDEDGGAGWSPALRIRYMGEVFTTVFEQLGAPELGSLATAGGISYRDFRVGDGTGEGRGRMYTTRTGPHRIALVIFFDDRGIRPSDEDLIRAMLHSVRMR